jgi:hypothetical protein
VPDVSQTAGEMSTLISLVDSGMGVALLPESAARLRDAKVVACTIRDRLPPSQIGMIVSKTNDAPVVEKFCELASQIKAWTHLELETVFLMDDWGRHGSAIGKGSTPEEQLEFFVAKYSPEITAALAKCGSHKDEKPIFARARTAL